MFKKSRKIVFLKSTLLFLKSESTKAKKNARARAARARRIKIPLVRRGSAQASAASLQSEVRKNCAAHAAGAGVPFCCLRVEL